ncbi:uncharacterized protein LOC141911078 [Tubulanus polymorphus]|uniref:uncharacterized protein LOC141911078 n=1 Tax=Tubulanus polymorphus TaxID=672921 RepID=UPI003DA424F3
MASEEPLDTDAVSPSIDGEQDQSGLVYYGPALPDGTLHPTSPIHSSDSSQPVTSSSNKHIKDAAAVPGVCGLNNLGNTCFMNAGLQCLLSNSTLVNYFLERYDDDDSADDSMTLTSRFSSLVNKMWSGQFSCIHPLFFKEMLAIYHPQFRNYRQHDCQEFLALVLDSLHEELNDKNHRRHGVVVAVDNVSRRNRTDYRQTTDVDSSVTSHSVSPATLPPSEEDSNHSTTNHRFESLLPADDATTVQFENISSSFIPTSDKVSSSSATAAAGRRTNDDSKISSSWSHENLVSSATASRLEPDSSVITAATAGLFGNNTAADSSSSLSRRPLSLQSIEEFYMKETKTKNINMAAGFDGLLNEEMKTDSEKFAVVGHESSTGGGGVADDDVNLNSVEFETSVAKCGYKKPIGLKDTNLLNANVNYRKSKMIDSCSASSSTFDAGSSIGGATAADGNINNVKRMRVDDEQKNVNVKSVLQVNVDARPAAVQATAANNLVAVDTPISPNRFLVNQLSPRSRVDDVVLRADGIFGADGGIPKADDDISFRADADIFRTDDDIVRANDKWEKYVAKNHTIIVNTFQGQFKSTVVCSVCQHISVTYEPFMYLSVPLPRAMEKQIPVMYIPYGARQRQSLKPTLYLVTINKTDLVSKIKTQLLKLLNSSGSGSGYSCGEENIILAEVFDNHISRILEVNMMVRYLKQNRSIYALEISSPVTMTTNLTIPLPAATSVADGEDDDASSITANPPRSPIEWEPYDDDEEVGTLLIDSTTDDACRVTTTTAAATRVAADDALDDDSAISSSTDDGRSYDVCSSTIEPNPDIPSQSSNDEVSISKPLLIAIDEERADGDHAVVAMDTTCAPSPVQSQWSSCAICLEEMVDSELMIHVECGGMLCHSCLQMSVKHYGDSAYVCPVCSMNVNPAEDFVQFSSNKAALKTRVLKIAVMMRSDTPSAGEMALFGHPFILNLPHVSMTTDVYKAVRDALPFQPDDDFDLLLTDGRGLRCSRCLYTDHCLGCEISPYSAEIIFQPSDNLCVRVTHLTDDQLMIADGCDEHESMSELRPDTPLTLQDCLSAFTESEVLDEQNPWYCSVCQKFQCAKKTMTVWRYPDSLVIYLKRFVFHDFSSTKIDAKVVFPMENLNLDKFVCSSAPAENLVYNLRACVCHFGGVSCGHYTSYSKHPTLNEWFYLNDESITQQRPLEDDYSNAYILFYQRADTESELVMPTKSIFEDLEIREGSPIGVNASSTAEPPSSCSSSMAVVPYQPITEEAINNLLLGLQRNDVEDAEMDEDK